jgi:hypothetical protein
VYHVLTKENKLPLSFSVRSKHTVFAIFRLPFAANKQSLPFPFSVCSKQMEMQMEIYIFIYTVYCRFKQEMEKRSPGKFS